MADDSLATPINKLPSVSTRDAPKATGDVSYADILKQQEMERHQFDQQTDQQQGMTPMQPQFQSPVDAPAPPMQQADFQQPMDMPPPPQMSAPAQYMDNPYAGYGGPPGPPAGGPLGDGSPLMNQAPPQKKWWRVWIVENKTGWIVAFVIFLLLTFVYPKIRQMPRFAGLPLPYWATGSLSALGAAMVTAINLSL